MRLDPSRLSSRLDLPDESLVECGGADDANFTMLLNFHTSTTHGETVSSIGEIVNFSTASKFYLNFL